MLQLHRSPRKRFKGGKILKSIVDLFGHATPLCFRFAMQVQSSDICKFGKFSENVVNLFVCMMYVYVYVHLQYMTITNNLANILLVSEFGNISVMLFFKKKYMNEFSWNLNYFTRICKRRIRLRVLVISNATQLSTLILQLISQFGYIKHDTICTSNCIIHRHISEHRNTLCVNLSMTIGPFLSPFFVIVSRGEQLGWRFTST